MKAEIQDKLRGMILLGAYGDALGAPHELKGLEGKVGRPADVRRLRPFRVCLPRPKDKINEWWVWPDHTLVPRDVRGMQ